MRFDFVNKVSFEYGYIASMVSEISTELSTYFDGKEYGSDIEEMIVCIITVNPEFDFFFKVRKPNYTKGEKTVIVDGVSVFLRNTLQLDIKLNDLNGIDDKSELKTLLFKEVKAAIDDYKKIKDLNFNKERFIEDLKLALS